MPRKWNAEEDQIISANYALSGPVIVARLLNSAGYFDRDAFSVMRRASTLKINRAKTRKNRILCK